MGKYVGKWVFEGRKKCGGLWKLIWFWVGARGNIGEMIGLKG
jgi:hypothetical protein